MWPRISVLRGRGQRKMETREDILKELKEIAPRLATVDKVNFYTVPADYFTNFKQGVLSRVKFGEVGAELKAIAPELATVKKTAVAEMPAAYFSSFSDSLLKKIRANEVAGELAEVAPTLSKLEKVNALQVPANYFNALPAQLLNKVKIEEKISNASSSKWLDSVNVVLEGFMSVVLKPKYSVAFAGLATTVIVGLMIFGKVQQGDNLDNQLASLTNDEINSYLDKRPDMYTDEVFESIVDEKMLPAADKSENVHAFKDALKDVDDAALDAAIAD